MNYNEKEQTYFCRFTFGQFFALILLEIVTLLFVFYLGSKFGTDVLGMKAAERADAEKSHITLTNPDQIAVAQDPAVKKMAAELVASSPTPELKQRVEDILKRNEAPVKTTAAAPAVAPTAEPAAVPQAPPAEPQAALAPAATETLSIQVGSYPTLEEADAKVQFWKNSGYPAYMMIADIPDKGRWYRVRVGSFTDKEEAKQYLAKMKEDEEVDAILVSTP